MADERLSHRISRKLGAGMLPLKHSETVGPSADCPTSAAGATSASPRRRSPMNWPRVIRRTDSTLDATPSGVSKCCVRRDTRTTWATLRSRQT